MVLKGFKGGLINTDPLGNISVEKKNMRDEENSSRESDVLPARFSSQIFRSGIFSDFLSMVLLIFY